MQCHQLQLVERICNFQGFAQRYVPLSAALPAIISSQTKDDSVAQYHKYTLAHHHMPHFSSLCILFQKISNQNNSKTTLVNIGCMVTFNHISKENHTDKLYLSQKNDGYFHTHRRNSLLHFYKSKSLLQHLITFQ